MVCCWEWAVISDRLSERECSAHPAGVARIAGVLAAGRGAILDRWLSAARARPGLADPDRVGLGEIPNLLDAILDRLRTGGSPIWGCMPPQDDPAILVAAREHARLHADQGLTASDVVSELRLLRQEIWATVRREVDDTVTARDLLSAEIIINDALDAAIMVGLDAITAWIEFLREGFLATTVHEVRQPITLIRATAQLAGRRLQRPDPDVAIAVEELSRIEAGADRMAVQLRRLVEVSRVALGRLDLEPDATDLLRLVEAARDRLPPETAARIAITVASETDPRGVWDAWRLEQVLDNLLSNAAKYSPAGGPIEVAIAGDAATITLDVRDRGIGIAADDIPRLFQRYTRSRTARAHGIEGLGLGLYLCRGIIEAHGGRVEATSSGPDHGATMRVVLPRRAIATPTGQR
jgi:signal transduction histidine kinase